MKHALQRSLLAAAELLPTTAEARRRQRSLRNELSAMPAISKDEATEHAEWTIHRQELRDAIIGRDARFFRLWPFVQATMHPNRAPYIVTERRILKESAPRWKNMARAAETGNHIHQAYHLLAFENATGTSLDNFGSLLEFGGGYGVMAESLKRLGVGGKHTIYDLPEFGALQRYYLKSRNVRSTLSVSSIEAFQQAAQEGSRPRLFIATWSLSEVPLEFRAKILGALGHLEGYLIAYQEAFAGVSNRQYFISLQEEMPQIEWREIPIAHLPGNYYLVGTHL